MPGRTWHGRDVPPVLVALTGAAFLAGWLVLGTMYPWPVPVPSASQLVTGMQRAELGLEHAAQALRGAVASHNHDGHEQLGLLPAGALGPDMDDLVPPSLTHALTAHAMEKEAASKAAAAALSRVDDKVRAASAVPAAPDDKRRAARVGSRLSQVSKAAAAGTAGADVAAAGVAKGDEEHATQQEGGEGGLPLGKLGDGLEADPDAGEEGKPLGKLGDGLEADSDAGDEGKPMGKLGDGLEANAGQEEEEEGEDDEDEEEEEEQAAVPPMFVTDDSPGEWWEAWRPTPWPKLNVTEVPEPPEGVTCAAFLETADAYNYSRSFEGDQEVVVANLDYYNGTDCDIGCRHIIFDDTQDYRYDARMFTTSNRPPLVAWTMESYTNYPETKVEFTHIHHQIAMTPRLDADVSAVYFGWNAVHVMRPPVPTPEKDGGLTAFISNCVSPTFRLEAIQYFNDSGLDVRGYGVCLDRKYSSPPPRVNHAEPGEEWMSSDIIPYSKFSMAFENSIEPDYVTEKYFRCLTHGVVPIVIGAPNIESFAPQPNSLIHIRSRKELPKAVRRIRYLLSNQTAYNEMLAYKTRGPTDDFLAMMDLSLTHPFCRLCITLADRMRRHERTVVKPAKRPCACRDPRSKGVTRHFYIRERGFWKFRSLFVAEPITVAGLHDAVLSAFGPGFKPQWAGSRPNYRRKNATGGWDTEPEIKIHRVYPVGWTTHAALRTNASLPFSARDFPNADEYLRQWVEAHPCGELEVVFV